LPKGKGPFPAAIVLDILGGTETLSRTIATHLAQNGIAGLYVQMAYYGHRRPPGVKVRMISPNLAQTMTSIQQTVLDLRLATAWLEGRPELDRNRLAIMGTSLGSIIAALTAEMEPRLQRVVVLLGGGGFADAFWDHPMAKPYRGLFELLGGTKEKVAQVLAPIDPLTCAANLKNRKLLIMAGKRDDILPPKMAENLWKASGEQKLVWFDCTHYGAIVHLAEALEAVVEHLKAP
jgi:dienelactone hydrolase